MSKQKRTWDAVTVTIFAGIFFLLVAIPVTLIMQQQSVYEITPTAFMADDYIKVTDNTEEVVPLESVVDGELDPAVDTSLPRYITVLNSCGVHFEGECLRVRSGPGLDYPVVSSLRTGIVLKISDTVEGDGMVWHQVVFDEWLRYPERLNSEWYVAAKYVAVVYDEGIQVMGEDGYAASTTKVITIDRSDQMLYAYEGDELFMEESISTGIELSPTPRGTFTIFRKTPTRYMQGPLTYLAMSKYYDLPGVPWNLYFTEQGAVIHGAYWHDSFGKQYSSGCVNVHPLQAQVLYQWADLGTTVVVRD